jgi:putative flavoprotein involved in K+ transport
MERFDCVVIGGGQMGLGMGYRLQRAGLTFVIVDDRERTGDVWRERWGSLVLFTPRAFDQLPGLGLGRADARSYPTRTHIADYLERYRQHFALPVYHGFRVSRLERDTDGFAVSGERETLRAGAVVLATGPFHTPRIPECAVRLDSEVWQGHSSSYRNPSTVPPGSVLVVGGGNSAAQIAEELSATHEVAVASDGPIGYVPRSILGVSLFRLMDLTGILRADKDAWISTYARPFSDIVIGYGLRRRIRKKIIRHVPHPVVDCAGRTVIFADGSRRPVESVLWCTGFRPGYDWIKVDGALEDTGVPRQDRGVSPVPGLFWLGLAWQNRLNSALVDGVAAESEELLRLLLADRSSR